MSLAMEAARLRGKFLWLVPSPLPIEGHKLVLRAKALSGPDGLAAFPAQRLYLPGNEKLTGVILLVNVAVEMGDYRAVDSLRFERERCKERGRCTGVPDETDVAVANFGDEEDANSFLFRNPVEGYRGVILERYVAGAKGEEWRRTWGVFRVEQLDSRPELGGTYEARLLPAK